jgi:hypothetical protein
MWLEFCWLFSNDLCCTQAVVRESIVNVVACYRTHTEILLLETGYGGWGIVWISWAPQSKYQDSTADRTVPQTGQCLRPDSTADRTVPQTGQYRRPDSASDRTVPYTGQYRRPDHVHVFLNRYSLISVSFCHSLLWTRTRLVVYVRDWQWPARLGGGGSLHAVNVFRGSRGTAWLILHFDTRYRKIKAEAQCPLKKRIGGSESLSGCFGNETNILLLLQ